LTARARAWRRWPTAVAASFALFGLFWWMWEALRLPPVDPGERLGVAMGVAAVVSATLGAPLFFWAGQPSGPVNTWLPLVPAVAGWVDRRELAELVSALTTRGRRTVVLTTGLVGAGGFGKTTLAAKACQTRRVRRRFRGGIVWLTVGRDVNGPELATRVSELLAASGSDRGLDLTSAEQATRALGTVLSERGRVLLVVDDVWTASQLAPFAAAQQPWTLLITTRRPMVLDDFAARRIAVDAMPEPVARQLLTRDLPAMGAVRERELLQLTGRWPLAAEPGQPPPRQRDQTGREHRHRRSRRDGPAARVRPRGLRHPGLGAAPDRSGRRGRLQPGRCGPRGCGPVLRAGCLR
jgi:NB-ARC domain